MAMTYGALQSRLDAVVDRIVPELYRAELKTAIHAELKSAANSQEERPMVDLVASHIRHVGP